MLSYCLDNSRKPLQKQLATITVFKIKAVVEAQRNKRRRRCRFAGILNQNPSSTLITIHACWWKSNLQQGDKKTVNGPCGSQHVSTTNMHFGRKRESQTIHFADDSPSATLPSSCLPVLRSIKRSPDKSQPPFAFALLTPSPPPSPSLFFSFLKYKCQLPANSLPPWTTTLQAADGNRRHHMASPPTWLIFSTPAPFHPPTTTKAPARSTLH